METFTLFQINEFVRRIIALNLPDAVWVTAEIAQTGMARGHCFLSLVEKSSAEGEIVAQSEAVIWQKTYRRLSRRRDLELGALLQAGRQVRLQARVDFHERYGYKLIIWDIDPTYTLGLLEQQRQQTILWLEQSGLLTQNRQLQLPLVVQRLAVISSKTAAGYQDFMQQLSRNDYGYHFKTTLFEGAMQGEAVKTELPALLRRIKRRKADFDAVVIIRGGGARLDLTAFDERSVAEAITACPLPVITGIGHETDQTIADLVAHTPLKTPTAVADWLIGRTLQFEMILGEQQRQIVLESRQKLQQEQLRLSTLGERSRQSARLQLNRQDQQLQYLAKTLLPAAQARIREAHRALDQQEQMTRLLDVDSALRRGFTLSLINGKAVSSVQELKDGDRLTTQFRDGTAESTVTNTSKTEKKKSPKP